MQTVYDQHFQGQMRQARTIGVQPLAPPPPPPDPNLVSLIPDYWRSDAQVFLLFNVQTMVVEPYMNAGQPLPLMVSPLWPLLRDDISALVTRAQEIAQDRSRSYVSATSVAIALGQLAPFLKTTALQIWGPNIVPAPPAGTP